MTDKKIIPMPDTFKPLGLAASKVVVRLSTHRTPEDRERANEKVTASLNRFTEIQKGKSK